jgi:hypothetical protein
MTQQQQQQQQAQQQQAEKKRRFREVKDDTQVWLVQLFLYSPHMAADCWVRHH